MELGSRQKMISLEPIDAVEAPPEPGPERRAGRVRNTPEEITADRQLLEALGVPIGG